VRPIDHQNALVNAVARPTRRRRLSGELRLEDQGEDGRSKGTASCDVIRVAMLA